MYQVIYPDGHIERYDDFDEAAKVCYDLYEK